MKWDKIFEIFRAFEAAIDFLDEIDRRYHLTEYIDDMYDWLVEKICGVTDSEAAGSVEPLDFGGLARMMEHDQLVPNNVRTILSKCAKKSGLRYAASAAVLRAITESHDSEASGTAIASVSTVVAQAKAIYIGLCAIAARQSAQGDARTGFATFFSEFLSASNFSVDAIEQLTKLSSEALGTVVAKAVLPTAVIEASEVGETMKSSRLLNLFTSVLGSNMACDGTTASRGLDELISEVRSYDAAGARCVGSWLGRNLSRLVDDVALDAESSTVEFANGLLTGFLMNRSNRSTNELVIGSYHEAKWSAGDCMMGLGLYELIKQSSQRGVASALAESLDPRLTDTATGRAAVSDLVEDFSHPDTPSTRLSAYACSFPQLLALFDSGNGGSVYDNVNRDSDSWMSLVTVAEALQALCEVKPNLEDSQLAAFTTRSRQRANQATLAPYVRGEVQSLILKLTQNLS